MSENKRFQVHSMIRTNHIGADMDLEHCKELIEKYGSSQEITLMITDNGKNMTYIEVADLLNNLTTENEKLKQIIKEHMEYTPILDELGIFNE